MSAGFVDTILAELQVSPSDLIGSGRRSLVYALDANRVLRILKVVGNVPDLTQLQAFLAEIDGRAPIATPRIETIDPAGRYTIERRLPGTAMTTLLPSLKGMQRDDALTSFLTGTSVLDGIEFPDRPYGQILGPAPIHTDTWTEYFRRSLNRALLRNGSVIAAEVGAVEDLRGRALALLDPLEPRPRKTLVHGDYFPGNVLLDGLLAVCALVDFSGYTLVGDPLYDTITAPIFLEMAPQATPADVEVARGFVERRLGEAARPAARFYRVHAAFVMADPGYGAEPYPGLFAWSLTTLRQLRDGTLPD
jgi:hypothetical protein